LRGINVAILLYFKDILIGKLIIDPPGDTISISKAMFLDLRSSKELDKNITINIPKTAVKGSERIFIATASDPLSVPINNMENLIQYPIGKA